MSDEDSSVGHPEQPDSASGSVIDAYFNLNPEKFESMPTGEFLKLAKQYQEVNESYEHARQALLDLDVKKKQLEDEARSHDAVGQSTEQSPEAHDEQPALEQAIKNQEEHHDEQQQEQSGDNAQQPAENNDHHSSDEQPADLPIEHTNGPSDSEHPQISRAETEIGGGPAL